MTLSLHLEISSPPDPRSNISAVETNNPEALSLTTFSSYWLKIISVIFSQVRENCWRMSIKDFIQIHHDSPYAYNCFIIDFSFSFFLLSHLDLLIFQGPHFYSKQNMSTDQLEIHVINHTLKLHILIYVFCFHLKNS